MLAILRQRNFFLLWFAGIISMTGTWMLLIFLPLYVYRLTGSTLATGAMFISVTVPDILFGPIVGVFVDRWDRKRTLIVANTLLTFTLIPLLAVRSTDTLWIVYVVAFVEAFLSLFVRVAESALVPTLVPEKDLVTANSLNALSMNISRLAGPALGGIAAVLVGLSGIVLLDAASYLIAGGLIFFISGNVGKKAVDQVMPAQALKSWINVWKEWFDSLIIVRQERLLFILFAMMAIISFGEGVFGALFIPFVNKILHGGSLELGWLMTAQGIGGVIGGVFIGWLGSKQLSYRRLLCVSACLFGLIDLAIFNYSRFISGFYIAIVLFIVVGFPDAGFSSSSYSLLQSGSEDRYRGRIFGTLNTLRGLLGLSGMVFASLVGDHLGIVSVLNLQGYGYLIAGIIAFAVLKGKVLSQARVEGASGHAEIQVQGE